METDARETDVLSPKPECPAILDSLNRRLTECDVCHSKIEILHITFQSIEVRVPNPMPSHGLTITRRGILCKECFEPERLAEFREMVWRNTIAQHEAGCIPATAS
jgi:hypothetical protein